MNKVSEERKFLHDISTPVAAGAFTIEGVLETVKADPLTDPGMLGELERIYAVFEQITKMIQKRRATLIAESQDSGA